MMGSQRVKYSPEFKEAAVRDVIDNSRRSPIADVARSLGVVEQTLGNWVKAGEQFGEEARKRYEALIATAIRVFATWHHAPTVQGIHLAYDPP